MIKLLLLTCLFVAWAGVASAAPTRCGENLAKSAADVVAAHKKNPRVFVVLVHKAATLKVAPTSGDKAYGIPDVCITSEGFFAVTLRSKRISFIAYQSGATFYKTSYLVSVGKFRGWIAPDDVTEYGVLSPEELKTIASYANGSSDG